MVFKESNQLLQPFSSLKLPNLDHFLDNLLSAESEREKEPCGMSNRTVGFTCTTYCADVLCSCYWVYEDWQQEPQANAFLQADEEVLAEKYCRFHWRQWDELGGRMASNCVIIACCWMTQLSCLQPKQTEDG